MPDDEDEGREPGAAYTMLYSYFDEHWMTRARISITETRRLMIAHKQRQTSLCDDSLRCIELSRSLLKQSMPLRPAWLAALR